ncbi:MAG: radical SAM protein [Elusimicrobia bacterium]|nr:radical SAM protein [Elusimicrobiota bacterium]
MAEEKPLDLLLIDDEDDLFRRTDSPGTSIASPDDASDILNVMVRAVRWFEPPKLGVALLSAQAKAAGHSVESIYRPLLPWKKKAFRRLLERRPRVAGITTVSIFETGLLKRFTAEIRRISPGTIIVLGGHGAENTGEIRALGDLTITRHGEGALAGLLTALKGGAALDRVPGVAAADGSLSMEGCLRYEGIPRVVYPDWSTASTASWRYPVEASRGCKFNCSYCGFPGKAGQVFRPAAEVVEEMLYARELRGIRRFEFVDSSLTSDPEFMHELCSALRKSGLRADWKCFARPDAFDHAPELAAEMAAAGCSKVFMGIEAIHDQILSRMRRGMDRGSLERGLERVFKAGIKVHGNFIIGFPGETEATVRETAGFISRQPFSSVYLCTFGMSQEMLELAAKEPERYCHLSGKPTKRWRHDGMDYLAAYKLTVWAARRINLSKLWPMAISPVNNSPDQPPF